MIKGHSNFDLSFYYDNKFLVRKSSTGSNIRLYQQGIKQETFPKTNLYSIPNIHTLVHNDSDTYFVMDYVKAHNFIEYFNNSDLKSIVLLSNKLIEIIEYFLSKCQIQKVMSDLIYDKYIFTKSNIIKNGIHIDFQKYDLYFNNLPSMELPIGICHGDLTLSNILFDADNLILIDFLDSFIESPIIDIVKVRQDTKFDWSSSLYHKHFDHIKIKIILNFIDSKISNHFKKYDFYIKNYVCFEILNILRILQYAKDEKTIEKLKKDLYKCEI